MRTSFDLLVVGAGPVGLATAIEGALAGMQVAVIDPRQGSVDKACGEGLMPGARAALDRLGVEVAGWPFRGIRYADASVGGERQVTAAFRRGPGLGVRRTELSRGLAARAVALGVERVSARAGVPVQGDGWVQAAGLRASWLVAADGLHSPIRRALGLEAPAVGTRRFGLRRHYAVAPWADVVEVYWAHDAEAYVTPVDADTVGVAVLCGGGGGYDEWLDRFPALRQRVAGAPVASTVRGAGPLRQRATRRVAGRVLLAGDAAGYVDALTGEGIAVGLAGARALVGCLVAGSPESYESAWCRVSRRYRVLTHGLLWSAQQRVVRRAIVPAARAMPAVFGAVVNRLA